MGTIACILVAYWLYCGRRDNLSTWQDDDGDLNLKDAWLNGQLIGEGIVFADSGSTMAGSPNSVKKSKPEIKIEVWLPSNSNCKIIAFAYIDGRLVPTAYEEVIIEPLDTSFCLMLAVGFVIWTAAVMITMLKIMGRITDLSMPEVPWMQDLLRG